MTKASREAFLRGIKNGNITTDRQRVYLYIKRYGQSNMPTLEKYLSKSFNEFSGRLTELANMGLIKEIKTNRYTIYRIVSDEKEQERLAEEREYQRFLKWIKLGHRNDYFQKHLEQIKMMAELHNID
jgi:hypothetical protein